jgi:hypothetical protein
VSVDWSRSQHDHPSPRRPTPPPSLTRTVHRGAEGVSRVVEAASLREPTLDAREHSGGITGAMWRRTRPVLRYGRHPAVIFTLNQALGRNHR